MAEDIPMVQMAKPDMFDPSAMLTQLLAEAQAEMVNPPKSKTGQKGYQTYAYSPLDVVLNIIRPPLNKRGIFFYQRSEVAANGAGMLLNTIVAFGGEERVLDVKPYEYDSDPQIFGKRETYARRYSALMAFGLVGEEDTDGDTGPKETKEKAPTKPRPSKRKVMLAKIAKLKAECIQNGVKEEGLRKYEKANFGTDDTAKLTDGQLEELGKHLAQMARDSKEID